MADNVSLKIWNAIEPLVNRKIEEQTRNCQRMKSMTVSTAYNAQTGVVGVTEAFGKEIFLPVISTIDAGKLTVGVNVWVSMPYSSMSNAIVTMMGDGDNGHSIKELLDAVYPVGSLYMSVNSAEPSILFGGTWERLKDRFLLAAGDSYAAGATGGEAAHTLTVNEMPNHGHAVHVWDNAGTTGNAYYYSGTTKKTHTGARLYNGTASSWVASGSTASAAQEGRGDVSGGTELVGGSAAHNNMPPYLAVYMWKRTA